MTVCYAVPLVPTGPPRLPTRNRPFDETSRALPNDLGSQARFRLDSSSHNQSLRGCPQAGDS